jgi:hypothetical protein
MSTPAGLHRVEDGGPDLNALAAFVDGNLDPRDRASVVAHLADCRQCRDVVATLAPAHTAPAAWWGALVPIAASLAVAAIGAGVYLHIHDRQSIGPPATAPTLERPATPPVSTEPVPGTAAPPATPPRVPRDRTRAAGTTSIAGKTFRLIAGEWIDSAYREDDFLPVIEIPLREDLNARPALRPFATLGSRFTVVLDGTVYRISIP